MGENRFRLQVRSFEQILSVELPARFVLVTGFSVSGILKTTVNSTILVKNFACFLSRGARKVLSHVFAWSGQDVTSRRGLVLDRFSARPAYVYCRISRK